ncbi:MAG: glycosyltransferase [Planctomycetes bacterium]|nr:glycosyltransferase [Planctomycetota bacterium]
MLEKERTLLDSNPLRPILRQARLAVKEPTVSQKTKVTSNDVDRAMSRSCQQNHCSNERSTRRSDLRVLLYGGSGAFQCPGGGEVQLVKTALYLRRCGIRAKLFNPWKDKLKDADVLHLFGTLPEHSSLVNQAREAGVTTMLSTIAWYDVGSVWHLGGTRTQSLFQVGKFLLRATCPTIPSWRRRLYHQVDCLLPNSISEAKQLVKLFGVARDKISVIPNGVDEVSLHGDVNLFEKIYDLNKFVLIPGRIEPRKNQLTLLRALKGLEVPIVFLGDTVPGYRYYERECRRLAGPEVHFLGRLNFSSDLLGSAYRSSSCVVLPGWFETPSLAALEAAIAEAPLVVTSRGCTQEYFGSDVRYVHPGRPREMRAAVESALENQFQERDKRRLLSDRILRNYHWSMVAERCREVYEKRVQ